MNKLNILLFLILLIINNYKILCDNCLPIINNISPINPKEINGLILIQGEFCENDLNEMEILFKINQNQSIECNDIISINQNSSTLIQCKISTILSKEIIDNFNYNQFYTVEIKLINGNYIEYDTYLFSKTICQCNDEKSGKCVYGRCICNDGYSGPTCSLKVLKYNNDYQPTGQSYNTFKLFLKDDVFEISTDSFNQVQLIGDNQYIQLYQTESINLMNIESDYSTNNYLSFNSISSNSLNNFTQLNYQVDYFQSQLIPILPIQSYLNTTETKTNFTNYFGTLLPVTDNSALVSISFNLAKQLNLNDFQNIMVEMVFSVINSESTLFTELSDDQNTLTIYNKKTSSYIILSMSDRYLFNGKISENHGFFRILPTGNTNDTIYFSITLPITQSFPQGIFETQFMINGYNIEEHLAVWKIIVISISSLIGLIICALIIFFFIKIKNKKFEKGLKMAPYYQPILKSEDIESEDEIEEIRV